MAVQEVCESKLIRVVEASGDKKGHAVVETTLYVAKLNLRTLGLLIKTVMDFLNKKNLLSSELDLYHIVNLTSKEVISGVDIPGLSKQAKQEAQEAGDYDKSNDSYYKVFELMILVTESGLASLAATVMSIGLKPISETDYQVVKKIDQAYTRINKVTDYTEDK
jgi:hypothetical protein